MNPVNHSQVDYLLISLLERMKHVVGELAAVSEGRHKNEEILEAM